MKRHVLAMLVMAAIFSAAALQAGGSNTENAPGPAAFARLKTLAGDWEGDSEMGKIHLNYELIAGGTSLVERESGEKMPAMMTVYYLDGDRLLLTHYCMAGNQPRMQARAFNPETGEIDFEFLDATNLKPGAGHMHNVKFRVTDSDHISAAWQFFENNQPKRGETFQYTRVK